MRVGVVSDIHCNAAGLERALELMGAVDALLCLGDCIYEYRFSNHVVATLRERGAHVIRGNHEEAFFGPGGARARAAAGIDPALAEWLAGQPLRRDVELGGLAFHLCHSTPWEPRGAYVIPEDPKLARFGETGSDVVLYGHTHRQVVRRFGEVLVVNPGSAGDARDARNGRRLSCAVVETDPLSAHIIDYDAP